MSLANASKLSGVVVALIFIACKAPVVLSTKTAPDKRLLSTWLFGLTIALALLFQIDQVFMFVGYISQVPNLAWLLSSSFLSIAYYFIVVSSFSIFDRRPDYFARYARIFLVQLIIFLLAYGLIFFLGGVAYASPYAGHNIPRSPGELIFANTFYFYTLSLMPIALSTALKLVRYEQGEIKVRMTLMLIAAVSLTTLTLLKIGTTLLGYFSAATIPGALFQLINILLLISSVTWPCMFLPSSYYQLVVKIPNFVGNLKTLFFLTYLRRRIRHFYPTSANRTPWWSQLQHPLLSIYEAIISIQEVKTVSVQASQHSHADEFILAMLHTTDDNTMPNEELVAAYVNIGQTLLKQELAERLQVVAHFTSSKATG